MITILTEERDSGVWFSHNLGVSGFHRHRYVLIEWHPTVRAEIETVGIVVITYKTIPFLVSAVHLTIRILQ